MTRWPEFDRAARNPQRLRWQMEVATENPELRIIDSEAKRNKMLWLVWGKENPELGRWLKERLYDDPHFFEKLNISSADTILRDRRYLEEGDLQRGIPAYFEKAKDRPVVEKQTTFG